MKQFVYVNAYCSRLINHSSIKTYLTSKLESSDWLDFTPNTKNDDVEYQNGITVQQYEILKQIKTGIIINPLILGFKNNYEGWVAALAQESYSTIAFVEIPYEIYQEASRNQVIQIDRDTFDIHTLHARALAEALRDDLMKNVVIH